MRFFLVAALLVSTTALGSARPSRKPARVVVPHAIVYCGPMGDESMKCVANELAHGWPAVVSVTCSDGAEATVRVWIDNAGELQLSPPTYAEACK